METLRQFVFRKIVLKITAWDDKSVCCFVRNVFLWSRFREQEIQGSILEKKLGHNRVFRRD